MNKNQYDHLKESIRDLENISQCLSDQIEDVIYDLKSELKQFVIDNKVFKPDIRLIRALYGPNASLNNIPESFLKDMHDLLLKMLLDEKWEWRIINK